MFDLVDNLFLAMTGYYINLESFVELKSKSRFGRNGSLNELLVKRI